MAQINFVISILSMLPLFAFICHAQGSVEARTKLRWDPLPKFHGDQNQLVDLINRLEGSKTAIRDLELETKAQVDIDLLEGQYRRLFPSLMTNKDKPLFVITNWSTASAAAVLPRISDRPDILMLPKGIYAPTVPAQVRWGFIAHELAHIFLGHLPLRTVLSLSRPEMRKDLERYILIADLIGPDQVAGLPLGGFLADQLLDYAFDFEKFSDGNPDLCVKSSHESLTRLSARIRNGAKSELSNSSAAAAIKNIRACAKKLGFRGESFRNAEFNGTGEPMSSERMLKMFLRPSFTWKNVDELAVILELSQKLRPELLSLRKKLEGLTWRGFEDEADEFAIYVLRSLNIDIEPFLRAVVEMFDNDYAFETCAAKISKGEPISFGELSDNHHSSCYRMKRGWELYRNPDFRAEP